MKIIYVHEKLDSVRCNKTLRSTLRQEVLKKERAFLKEYQKGFYPSKY